MVFFLLFQYSCVSVSRNEVSWFDVINGSIREILIKNYLEEIYPTYFKLKTLSTLKKYTCSFQEVIIKNNELAPHE